MASLGVLVQRVADTRQVSVSARASRLIAALALVASLVWIYVFFTTAGTGQLAPSPSYHDNLAEAFIAGQLHLLVTPPPELLALPDPYDPRVNHASGGLGDASLYKGRYYIYWGPVTALLHVPSRLLLGIPLPTTVLMVVAVLITTWTFWGSLGRVRQFWLPTGANWVVWGSTAVFALGGVTLYMLARPSVYHEAIVVAAGFMLPSWYCLLRAFEQPDKRRRYLLASGVLLGAAIGARIDYLGYLVGPGLVLGWAFLRAGRGTRLAPLVDLATFGTPLAVTGALLMLYNWLRFDSPFEFGVRYLLQGSGEFYEWSLTHSFLSLSNLLVQLPLYLLSVEPIDLLHGGWPFAHLWVVWIGGAGVSHPLWSMFLIAPVTLLTLGVPLLSRGPWSRFVLAPLQAWIVSILLGAVATLLILSTNSGIGLRYYWDFLPGLTLIGSVMLLSWTAVPHHRRTWRITLALSAVAWAVTLIFGVHLGLFGWLEPNGQSYQRTALMLNDWIGRVRPVVAPWSVDSWAEPAGITTYRDESTWWVYGSTAYLRAPSSDTALALDVYSRLPAASEVTIRVNGEPVLRQALDPGFGLLVTPPLTDLTPGSLVAIQIEPPNAGRLTPGVPVQLTVTSLRFARGKYETDAYARLGTAQREAQFMRTTAEGAQQTAERLQQRTTELEQALQAEKARADALERTR